MSVDITDPTRSATQRPWRLKRRVRTPHTSALPPPPRSRIRAALVVAAVLSGSTLAGALGATAIGGKRAEAAPTPEPIGMPPQHAYVAQVSSAFETRSEGTVVRRSVKPASVSSNAPMARRRSAPAEDRRPDHSALGVRARLLSDRERGEIGAGAPDDGWKIVSAGRGSRLRRGDVIVGVCGSGFQPSLGVVMARLIKDSKITRCLDVLRNGEAMRVGPGETGPSP